MAFTESPIYSYNRGQIWFGTAVAGGMPQSFDTDIAAIDTFEFTLTPEYVEHMNKQNAVALKDIRAVSAMTATGKLTCSQRNVAILQKWLYGSSTTITGGAISATAFDKAAGVAVGDILPAPGGKTKLSSVVITDSTGSPKTLTLGVNYELDADAGLVKFLDVTTGGAYVQPFKLAATEAAGSAINLFQSVPPLQGLRFKGINILNSNAIEVMDIPKLQLSAAGAYQLLGDGNSPASFEWDFEILADASNLTYPFGRLRN